MTPNKNHHLRLACILLLFGCLTHGTIFADTDTKNALRRAKYLLSGNMPTDQDFSRYGDSVASYRQAVRGFIASRGFYDVLLRYHERTFGVRLPETYLDELLHDDIDNKTNKVSRIKCGRTTGENARFRCVWYAKDTSMAATSCPESWEQSVSVFWYPQVVAWVCPSIAQACGADLSRCFIDYENKNEAKNSELGATETFDTVYNVVRSLSLQAAGLATAVVMEDYPYSKILEPGLTAVDGAIAHFYRLTNFFDISKLHVPDTVLSTVEKISLTDNRFRLVHGGAAYESAGILSTFGYLRRYEKNRTRANQLYERLMCRRFTADLPRVFPQDPGNLRETPGCSGCHATLDPLADFFKVWGEGGELYQGSAAAVSTSFNGHSGTYLADLAHIIQEDSAFATCSVQHVWEWLMGRGFYHDEADLRTALTQFFVQTNFNFKDLVFAVATHPVFMEGKRSDATVGDPLEQPPLGQITVTQERTCKDNVSYATDIAPKISNCTPCHYSGATTRQDLSSESQWLKWGTQAVNMMGSGNMPPGQTGAPVAGTIFELKEAVRCWLEQKK